MTHKIAGKEHNAAVSVTLDNTGSAFDTGERYVEFTNVGTLPARPTGCGVDPAGANDSPLNTEVTLNWFGVQTVDWLQTSSIACFGDIQPGERWRLPFRFVGSLSNDSMGQSISPTLYMDFGEVPAGLAATEKPHVAAGDGQTFDIIVD